MTRVFSTLYRFIYQVAVAHARSTPSVATSVGTSLVVKIIPKMSFAVVAAVIATGSGGAIVGHVPVKAELLEAVAIALDGP